MHATDNPANPSSVVQRSEVRDRVAAGQKFSNSMEIVVMVAIGLELGFAYE